MTHTQQHAIMTAGHDWLTQGLLTPMQGLERAAALKVEGKNAVADVMIEAVQTWHDADVAHTQQMLVRGI
jgi:hypothetical protein